MTERSQDDRVQDDRPQNEQPLPTTADALLARLQGMGVAYVEHRHAPLFTVEDSKQLRGELPGGHCKNLFLKDRKGQYWLVVALEDRPIDLKTLDKKIGAARLSFGSADRLWEVLGVRPGAVTPFSLINDTARQVKLVLDKGMLVHDPLNYHPLVNDRTIAVSPEGLLAFLRQTGHDPMILDLQE
ncbi:prolyl-tRNA synthetase associated domain-containing protein [Oceanibaculum indicum]|uniref:Ala-tRNA(Pro) deacylase n=1 Tax=Oceanibaculum indicum TaxID=526216 RepID=A0A420WC87_9PROT|nr:prolyl-tRNA synthetase associated domain-containing protein [Oceanibaculum indicum]RKQ68583.1 Ala-tRNA(Pro) deacylase [Oceanibaculum indicum]